MEPAAMEPNFRSSEHWSAEVSRNLAQCEIEGGVDLRTVAPETVLAVKTRNRVYTLVMKGSGRAMICGHPQYCPEPVLVHVIGSTWGGAMLKEAYLGRGMRLEFQRDRDRPVLTSPILEIEERHGSQAV